MFRNSLAAGVFCLVSSAAHGMSVDFDRFTPDGPLIDNPSGAYLSFNHLNGDEFSAFGISNISSSKQNVSLFNSDCGGAQPACTGGDRDLASGPGVGSPAQGLVLIVDESDGQDPDDSTAAPLVTFEFSKATYVNSITLLDVDKGENFNDLSQDGALTQTFYDESLKFVGIDPSDVLVNIIFAGVGSKHDNSIVEFIFSDPVALTSFSMKLRKGTSLAVAELDITPVPLPAGLPLMLSALAGFAVFRRRGARVGAR